MWEILANVSLGEERRKDRRTLMASNVMEADSRAARVLLGMVTQVWPGLAYTVDARRSGTRRLAMCS